MPVGFSLGYIFGGQVALSLSWRAAFWIEAGLALPMALWFYLATPLTLKSSQRSMLRNVDRSVGLPSDIEPEFMVGDDKVKQGGLIGAPPKDDLTNTAEATTTLAADTINGHLQKPSVTYWDNIKDIYNGYVYDFKALWQHRVCVLVILGLAGWNGYVGVFSWWGPKATMDLFPSMTPKEVDFTFGLVSLVTGW